MSVQLQLPWPNVTTNHLYGNRRDGSKYLTAWARAFREEAVLRVRTCGQSTPSGPLSLTLRLWPPDRRRRDCDNAVKLTQDSLCAGLNIDDSQIAELHVYREAPAVVSGGRIDVELSETIGRNDGHQS